MNSSLLKCNCAEFSDVNQIRYVTKGSQTLSQFKARRPNTEKTLFIQEQKKMSDPQPAPPTVPHTNRWPRHYHPILAISSYKQISESHKISFHVYGLVKAKQTITSWHIIHFSSTPREQEKKLCSAPLGGHVRPKANSFVAHTHTQQVHACMVCAGMCILDKQQFTASVKPVYSIALCEGPSFAAGWEMRSKQHCQEGWATWLQLKGTTSTQSTRRK